MDAVLSSIKSTWDSSIFLAADTNTDLLSSPKACDMSEKTHVTKPAREGKKLIDPVSSKIKKNNILHSDILLCPIINNHDAPYIVIKYRETNLKYVLNSLETLETFVRY